VIIQGTYAFFTLEIPDFYGVVIWTCDEKSTVMGDGNGIYRA